MRISPVVAHAHHLPWHVTSSAKKFVPSTIKHFGAFTEADRTAVSSLYGQSFTRTKDHTPQQAKAVIKFMALLKRDLLTEAYALPYTPPNNLLTGKQVVAYSPDASVRTLQSNHRATDLLGGSYFSIPPGNRPPELMTDQTAYHSEDTGTVGRFQKMMLGDAGTMPDYLLNACGIKTPRDVRGVLMMRHLGKVDRTDANGQKETCIDYHKGQAVVDSIARSLSPIPMISLETAKEHPLQAYADILTILETKPRILQERTEKIKHLDSAINASSQNTEQLQDERDRLIQKGDKITVGVQWVYSTKTAQAISAPQQSLIELSSKLEFDVVRSHPEGFEFDPKILDACAQNAQANGSAFSFTSDPCELMQTADVVYVRTWSPITDGTLEPTQNAKALADANIHLTATPEFLGWSQNTINPVYAMHCLPAVPTTPRYTGEMSAEVLHDPKMLADQQSGNRNFAAAGILALHGGHRQKMSDYIQNLL